MEGGQGKGEIRVGTLDKRLLYIVTERTANGLNMSRCDREKKVI